MPRMIDRLLAGVVAALLASLLICTVAAADPRPEQEPPSAQQEPGAEEEPPSSQEEPAPDASASPEEPLDDSLSSDPDEQEEDESLLERLGTYEKGQRDMFPGIQRAAASCYFAGTSAETRANCESSGSMATPHPWSHYMLDVHVDASPTGIVKSFGGNVVMAQIQMLISAIWTVLLMAFKLTTLALEWAFSIKLLSDPETAGDVNAGLLDMHRSLGAPWQSVAFAITGLWAIWNGVFRQRYLETGSGLLVTVLLMCLGLGIINRPDQTVGLVSRLAHHASLTMLAGASEGSFDQPVESFARAERQLFSQSFWAAWCVMQFGDYRWCNTGVSSKAKTKFGVGLGNVKYSAVAEDRTKAGPGDLWAAAPPGSTLRNEIYVKVAGENRLLDSLKHMAWIFGPQAGINWTIQKGGQTFMNRKIAEKAFKDVKKEPERVQLMQGSGTLMRLGLLCVVSIDLISTMCVLGWLAACLIGAGLMGLFMLMLSPLACLAAGLGPAGRDLCTRYFLTLFGMLLAPIAIAAALAAYMRGRGIIAGIDSFGYLTSALITSLFSIVVFRKRRLLYRAFMLNSKAADSSNKPGVISTLSHAAQLYRGVKDIYGDVTAGTRAARQFEEQQRKEALADWKYDQREATKEARSDAKQRANDEKKAIDDKAKEAKKREEQDVAAERAAESEMLADEARTRLEDHAREQIKAGRFVKVGEASYRLEDDDREHKLAMQGVRREVDQQEFEDLQARRRSQRDIDADEQLVEEAETFTPSKRDISQWIDDQEVAMRDTSLMVQGAADRKRNMHPDDFTDLLETSRSGPKRPLEDARHDALLNRAGPSQATAARRRGRQGNQRSRRPPNRP